MKRIFNFVFISTLFAFTSVFADPNCRIDHEDIFEPDGVILTGDYAGKCLSTHVKRSFYIAGTEEINKIGFKPTKNDSLIVANISHLDKFGIAEVPVDSIFRVIFHYERFFPKFIAAHTQLRFDFRKPIYIYDQKNPRQLLGSTESLVLTVEAITQNNGDQFNFLDSAVGKYALVYRLTSLSQKVVDQIFRSNNTVDQYELYLNENKSQKLFTHFINKLKRKQITEQYELFYRNCTNVLFENIDEFLNYERNDISRMLAVQPIISPAQLLMRHLVDSIYPNMPELSKEFEHHLDSIRKEYGNKKAVWQQ